MFTRRKWTDSQLIEAVAASRSVEEVSRRLGLTSASAAHRTLPKHIKRLGLKTEHLVGRRASGNRTKGRFNERSLSEVLASGTHCGTSWLKKKLLAAGKMEYACSACGIASWNGLSLSLQLDHINGDRTDNRIENLRLLCPNCHSQTATYAGKNAGRRKYMVNCG